MGLDQTDGLLSSGIAAAKKGDFLQARKLLLTLLDEDEQNEKAWLWLSSVVESSEDKRICLENVLTINPANAAAIRGIQRLDAHDDGDDSEDNEIVIKTEITPVSPAASILYPDRTVREWRFSDPPLAQKAVDYSIQSESGYDDIWEGEQTICPYCAEELDYEEWRCPTCKRNLRLSAYRHQKPSSDLLIYSVLVFGIAQLSLLLVVGHLIVGESVLTLVWNSLVFILMVIFAIGIFLRQFWAYIGSVITLITTFASLLIALFVQPSMPSLLEQLNGKEFFLAVAERPLLLILEPLVELLLPLQLVAVALAFVYAIFRVGPDFERVIVRRVAGIDKGLSGASMFYTHGKDYTDRNMWANAVLHFRRAAGQDPTKSIYLLALGRAYAKVGYYQRSLDVLESALAIEADQQKIAEIKSVMQDINQQQLAHHDDPRLKTQMVARGK